MFTFGSFSHSREQDSLRRGKKARCKQLWSKDTDIASLIVEQSQITIRSFFIFMQNIYVHEYVKLLISD